MSVKLILNNFKYGQEGILPLAIAFFQGQYHLFFSFRFGKGVFLAKSLDLYEFSEIKLFLPDNVKGICSAVVKNEKIYFFYSSNKSKLRLITMDVKGNTEKYPLAVINEKGLSDPKVFHDGEKYYLIGCDKKGFSLYSSENLLNYEFCVSEKSSANNFCCPSLHKMGEDWFMIFSDLTGVYSQKALFDGKTKLFKLLGDIRKIDDIILPRISHLNDGRTIMTGTFNNCFVIREIWGRNGQIMILPLRDVNQHKKPCTVSTLKKRYKHEEEINLETPLFAQFSINSDKSNDFLCSFSSSIVYPEYLYINCEQHNISICTGRPFGRISNRSCLLFPNLIDIEMYFYDKFLEVFIKSLGVIVVSSNPFLQANSKKIILNVKEEMDISLSLARIE